MSRISDMIFRGFCICENGDKYITVNKTPRKGKWIIGDICHLPLGQAASSAESLPGNFSIRQSLKTKNAGRSLSPRLMIF